MAKIIKIFFIGFLTVLSIFLYGCIHEYPEGKGVDPSEISSEIELTVDLNWTETEDILHFTKARNESARIIIEVRKDGEIVGRDEINLSENYLNNAEISHTLSFKLNALLYDIGVWFETVDENGNSDYRFDVSDLSDIKIKNYGLDWNGNLIAGYANDNLDLREYKGKWDVRVKKKMSLKHAGARYRLMTTDMKGFVKDNLDDIERGETYTLTISYSPQTADGFNVFTGEPNRSFIQKSVAADFVPTYQLFDETDIAEGFVFCDDNEDITMNVSVQNSARLTITKSPDFSFSIKRGNLTIVKGSFLSEKISNFLWVDTQWEDEIIIDL